MFDNGRLKQATYDTAQGFGLRAVKDEAVGYAHASDVSEAALARAADAVRAVKGGHSGTYAEPPGRTNRKLYGDDNPLGTPAFEAKVKLLEEIDAYARAKDARVRQLSASIGATWQVVEILRADGTTYRDIRPMVRLSVSAVVGDGDRQESGSYGFGGREGYERFITPDAWQGAVDEAIRQALVNLDAVPAPAGEMDVVLGSGWPGVMLHEAVGHGLEGDFNRKKTSAFAGLMGQQVAAKGVTVVDDGTMQQRRGSLSIDDEGTPTNRTVLIEDGILVGYMQDRQNARLMKMKPTGNGRREIARACADAAHDQHLHARRQARSERDHRLGEERPLRRELRRRPGRHHLGQIRVPVHRGLQDRERQGHGAGEGRHADRQRPDRPASHLDGRQRLRARSRHRHLRQERPGRAGRRRPAILAHGQDHRGRHRMSSTIMPERSRLRRWTKSVVDLAFVVLVVLAAKAAIAEPFYVPSGSMEPTLLIGDELLATKYPYGYSTASLPALFELPSSPRILGALPQRGDVVVFRWPGDRSQVWVKRVIGLPGDRIAMRDGHVVINGEARGVAAGRPRPDGKRKRLEHADATS